MNKVILLILTVVAGVIFLGYFWIFDGDSKISNTDNLSKVVLRGSIDVTDDKIESISLWVRGKEANGVKFAKVETGTSVSVDVLNCSGYIATATATLNEHQAWEIKMIPETIASDAVKKIEVCDGSPESTYISSNAFAVAPLDEKRRQIKLNKLEKPSTYTLPISVQMWAESEIGNWTDTDGDGAVDLISVSGKCGTSEDYFCTRVLSWNGLRWTEIAYTKPA